MSPFNLNGVIVYPILTSSPADAEMLENLFTPRYLPLPIRHYIPLRHLETLLRTGSLYLKRSDQYTDDPEECLYPDANLVSGGQMADTLYAEMRAVVDKKAMISGQRAARLTHYVHCWFEGDFEDPTMWRKYGEDGSGVCITTTSSKLFAEASKGLNGRLIVHVGRCVYRDQEEPICELFSFAPVFRKRRTFCVEREIRLEAGIPLEQLSEETPLSQQLSVDLDSLICGVITGPAMREEERARVRNLCEGVLALEKIRPSGLEWTAARTG